MEGFCRGCLLQYHDPKDLLQYTEKNRRLFIYSTGLQVKSNDIFPFQLCKQCHYSMKQSCKFKKKCRTSEMKFRTYLMQEDGDDFGSFLKNMEGDPSLRLIPLTSGHSTPVYQKNKDDDNESTCTSIRNFMTELLEGEEMPPTEERIIREVIEEEADLLDDSLDSHWLDESVGSDVDMDFGSSSPFATPRSIQNDHRYTPKRVDEAKQREINFLTSKEIIVKLESTNIPKYDMPLLEDLNSNMEFEVVYLDDNKIEANAVKSPIEFNNSIPSEVEDMVTENSISSTLQGFKTDLLVDLAVKKEMNILDNDSNLFDDVSKDSTHIKSVTKIKSDTRIENCMVLNQGSAEVHKSPTDDLDYYVKKAELRKQILTSKLKPEDYHCTIDRNLEIALKNDGKVQFPLDPLITSPAVSIGSGYSTPSSILFSEKDCGTLKYAGSTPMIEHILFGSNLNSQTPPKYFSQVGQSINDDKIVLEDLNETLNKQRAIAIKEEVDVDDVNETSNKQRAIAIKEEVDVDDVNETFNKQRAIAIKEEVDVDDVNETLNKQRAIAIKEEVDVDDEVASDELVKVLGGLLQTDDRLRTNNDLSEGEADDESDHMNVLEEFLQEEDGTPKLDDEIIDQIIDPDHDIFKRPMTPSFDKYDIEKCYCKICNKTYKSLKSLKIHFAKIHKYKFPNDDPHRNRSQNSKVHICAICGKAIKSASHFARHKKTHEDKFKSDSFQCDLCHMFFNSRVGMQVHMVKMHMKTALKKKKFVCPTCGKRSSTSSHNKLHQRRHLKEFSVFCEICDKGFYEHNAMTIHKRTHSGERPFSCKNCPKTYPRREQLYLHMKRHSGDFEYKCDVCNVEYVTKYLLAKHYSSAKCMLNREKASQKQKVTTSFGKGALDRIKKMMQAGGLEVEVESDSEDIENLDVESDTCDIKNLRLVEKTEELSIETINMSENEDIECVVPCTSESKDD